MPVRTDVRLKFYLDGNQLHREQLCHAVLSMDRRFSQVRARRAKGQESVGISLLAMFEQVYPAFGVIGFIDRADDDKEHKREALMRFREGAERAALYMKKPGAYVFFTNVAFTEEELLQLTEFAKGLGYAVCEVMDRTHLKRVLDSPEGYAARHRFLKVSMTEDEQAHFFNRWGEDLMALSTGGRREMERTLDRILFLQELDSPLLELTARVKLKEGVTGAELGHFRLFCSLSLEEVKCDLLRMLFGITDRPDRLEADKAALDGLPGGAENGILSAQWHSLNGFHNLEEERRSAAVLDGPGQITYLEATFRGGRYPGAGPGLRVRDLHNSVFILLLNHTLCRRIQEVSLHAGGFTLFSADAGACRCTELDHVAYLPLNFSPEELGDGWVALRPPEGSAFELNIGDVSPRRG